MHSRHLAYMPWCYFQHVSVVGSSLLKYKATALQTDGGYSTTANKRVQIAEHLRYLPMGYFNKNSLGAITSVTTNTMDNLSGVSTRVVMFVTEGIFSTMVMTLALFFFDIRVGILIIEQEKQIPIQA